MDSASRRWRRCDQLLRTFVRLRPQRRVCNGKPVLKALLCVASCCGIVVQWLSSGAEPRRTDGAAPLRMHCSGGVAEGGVGGGAAAQRKRNERQAQLRCAIITLLEAVRLAWRKMR